jgi:hypothetical protein
MAAKRLPTGTASSAEGIRPVPSFFVVGPPRTGTSWLHEVLGEHTLLPNPTKETRFFDIHFHRGTDWYLAHFPKSSGNRPVGEVASTYFASAQARERIARSLSHAKVVCIFRNPIERIFSLYRLKRAYGMIPWNFDQAIARDPELSESAKYATHLKAWRSALGADQVLATVYEDLRQGPQSYIDTLASFIGIPHFTLTESQIRYVHASDTMTEPRNYYWTRGANGLADWLKARRLDRVVAFATRSRLLKVFLGGGPAFAGLPPARVKQLYERFRPEVEELEALLNRDLSAWKYAGGRLTVARAIA